MERSKSSAPDPLNLEKLLRAGKWSLATAAILKGTDKQSIDEQKRTLLIRMIRDSLHQAAAFLITHDANLKWTDAEGMTALHHAAQLNAESVALLLIDQGAPYDLPDKKGRTPFVLALERDAFSLAAMFLMKGADTGAWVKYSGKPIDPSLMLAMEAINTARRPVDIATLFPSDILFRNKRFIGAKLRALRNAYGLSLRGLAQELAILDGTEKFCSHMAISKYEDQEAQPAQAILDQIAKYFRVKPEFFFEEELSAVAASFRPKNISKTGWGEKERTQWFEENRYVLEHKITLLMKAFEKSAIQPVSRPPAPVVVHSPAEVEVLTQQVRDRLGYGIVPIHDMAQFAEEYGIMVLPVDAPPLFDAAIVTLKGAQCILVGKESTPARQRFSIAHELGHVFIADAIDYGKNQTVEDACHRFARDLLLPTAVIKRFFGEHRDIIRPDELMPIKLRYGLSLMAIIYKLLDVGIIDAKEKNRLWKLFEERGWTQIEPLENKLSSPVPSIGRAALLPYVRAKRQRRNELALKNSPRTPETDDLQASLDLI